MGIGVCSVTTNTIGMKDLQRVLVTKDSEQVHSQKPGSAPVFSQPLVTLAQVSGLHPYYIAIDREQDIR